MSYQDSNAVVVLAKYGGTATSTDVIDVTEPKGIEVTKSVSGGKYKPATGKKGAQKSWVNTDNINGSVSLSAFLRGNDDTGLALDTPSGWSDVLQICALVETIDTTTAGQETVTYTPNYDDPAVSQVLVYRDGEKDTIDNALGNLSIEAKAGEQIMLKADITGFSNAKPVTEANPAFTEDENGLIVLKSTDNFSINGVSRCLQSFTFNCGNANAPIYCVGTKNNFNTDFEPYVDITYLANDANANDIWDLLTNGTKHEIILQAGSASGKKVEFKGYYGTVDASQDIKKSDSDGKLAYTVRIMLEDGTNGAYALKFGYFA